MDHHLRSCCCYGEHEASALAKSAAQSMRIFKKEINKNGEAPAGAAEAEAPEAESAKAKAPSESEKNKD